MAGQQPGMGCRACLLAYMGSVHKYLHRPLWKLRPLSTTFPIAARYEPRWVYTTPLGREVVPEVNGMASISSSSSAWT